MELNITFLYLLSNFFKIGSFSPFNYRIKQSPNLDTNYHYQGKPPVTAWLGVELKKED